MLVIGLTGSIATGKSFVATIFRKLDIPVFDSDKEVHNLLQGKAVEPVGKAFPEVLSENNIDRKKLGDIVFSSPDKRKKLENIIYPLLNEERENFLKECNKKRQKVVILDIPLLFENGLENICDYVIVTYVDEKIQKERALQRNGITEEKFYKIKSLQMADSEKIKKADFVVDTSKSEFTLFREIKDIIKGL